MFNPLLSLTEKSSTSQRELKILKRLRKHQMENEAYCLNDIFNVNFKTAQQYTNLTSKAKYKVLKNVFRNFCKGVRGSHFGSAALICPHCPGVWSVLGHCHR